MAPDNIANRKKGRKPTDQKGWENIEEDGMLRKTGEVTERQDAGIGPCDTMILIKVSNYFSPGAMPPLSSP